MKKFVNNFRLVPRFNEACAPVQKFEFEELCTQDGMLKSDIFVVTHAEHLKRVYGASAAKDFLDAAQKLINRPDNPLTSVRRHMSDAQIMMYIRPKNCQTPGELANWMEYLNAEELAHIVESVPASSGDSKADEPAVVAAGSVAVESK